MNFPFNRKKSSPISRRQRPNQPRTERSFNPSPRGAGPNPQDQRRRQQEARRRRNRSRAIVLTTLILLTVLLTAALVRLIVIRSDVSMHLRFVKQGTLYDAVDTRGILVRTEQILPAQRDGRVYPLASEGAKVAYGTPLAIQSMDEIMDQRDHLNDLRRQIASRQLELVSLGQGEGAEALYDETEKQLQQPIRQIAEAAEIGDLTVAYQQSLKIRNLIDQRNQQVGRLTFEDPILKELQDAQKNAERELSGHSETYVGQGSGIVSYSTDGLEEKLRFDQLDQLTVEAVQKFFEEKNQWLETTGDRKKDEAVARLVTGRYQAILLDIPESARERLEQASTVRCYFPDEQFEVADAKVIYKLPHARGLYLFVQTQEGVAQLIRRRQLTVQVRTRSESGLVVPLTALADLNAEGTVANLFTVRTGFAHVVPVQIKLKNGDSAVVVPLDGDTTLGPGTLVVENPGKLKNGDALE